MANTRPISQEEIASFVGIIGAIRDLAQDLNNRLQDAFAINMNVETATIREIALASRELSSMLALMLSHKEQRELKSETRQMIEDEMKRYS